MNISLINERVVFQKNSVSVDSIGNHRNVWEDYYSCFATIAGEGGVTSKERSFAGTTVEDVAMTVTVRYCQMTSEITSTGFRIMFHGEIYNITNIDHMNYRKKCLKFICKKVRR